jgi:uncharacterized protein (TIRG00374 family)
MRLAARIALQFAVSGAFLALLFWRVDVGKLWEELTTADWRWIGLALPCFAASSAFHGVRWWLLARRAGKVPLRDSVLALLATTGVDLVLPLRAGVAALVQIMHRRHRIDRAALVGTVGADGLVDVIALPVLVLVITPLLPVTGVVPVRALLVVGAVGLVVIGLVLLAQRAHIQEAMLKLVPHRIREATGRRLRSLIGGLATFGEPRTAALLLAATFADWMAAAVGYAIVGRGFALREPLPVYLIVEVAGNASSIVPLTQGNIGPYELIVQQVLTTAGADGAHAAAFAVGAHAVVLLSTLLTSILAAVALRLHTRDLFYVSAERDEEKVEPVPPSGAAR